MLDDLLFGVLFVVLLMWLLSILLEMSAAEAGPPPLPPPTTPLDSEVGCTMPEDVEFSSTLKEGEIKLINTANTLLDADGLNGIRI